MNSTADIERSREQADKPTPLFPGMPPAGETAEQPPSAEQPPAGQDQKPKTPRKQRPQPQPQVQPPQPDTPKPQAIKKARMTLSFDLGATKKGEVSLTIDGKPVKTQKIEKGLLQDNIWNITVEMPAGVHKVKVNLRTELMGVDTTAEEDHEFIAGKTTTLKVRIQKLSKKLIFTWSD